MKSRRRPYSEQRPFDTGGGVWSVPVPIPANPLGYTLIYAIESPAGPVLVDAGWNHPESWLALRDGLTAAGMDVREIRGVVVTHFHPDHAGLAGQVRQESGAWIAMHEADAALVRFMHDLEDGAHRDFQADMLRRAGAGAVEVTEVTARRPRPPAVPDLILQDGDLVDLPGRRLRTVWTPGHTPGHVCLHLEDADRLFTGDHVLPEITPHIGVYPYDRTDVDPLGDFLGSLEKVKDLGELEALPAHEWIFHDTAARAAEIGAHHEEKLRRLAGLLAEAEGPLTLWEVASRMTWNRPWEEFPAMSRGMAASEAAAHLRTLEVRGTVRRVKGSDPIRFVLHS
ncbi:glyoxylase-like metal-dependent hydrolase (beta-lactamase superfamily II) [Streptosporangium becharense]|uniref:Glyoxylase-like metal-dependent hydrolase (Beta-lactamase superfamily II) n=1 Tax=Streptosporangium becharense TaxID=1816182 RepID=A0A7W9MHP6_9ACTN|nr:MBL fold metallo-hydrolase [Streptosporangium becharense]MBB2913987.1 glyoxylase-like metal-dependent hydrolase (beta-lactamase superfamily II) [Streptosporangium becharense]MBB5821352.1 glyoxylase-like metal-dependent hydrolase (beta-lactamase superfamily II) [Streptosporangium becharense]